METTTAKMSDRLKIYRDIVHLHKAIETIASPLTARNQGMAIHQVPNDPFLNQLGSFRPALFKPRKAGQKAERERQKQKQKQKEKEKEKKEKEKEKEKRNSKSKSKRKSKEPQAQPSSSPENQTPETEGQCAAPASASSPSSPSSTSTTRAHRSFSLWLSTSSPPRPSSSCSSLSFGTFEPEPWLPEGSRLPVYPPVLKHVAEMNECERGLPALPGWGECVLEKDG
jgi:outer membrane biosynthesis protein TonB